MRQLLTILPPIALMTCALAFGACQSRETFDGAMLSTITDLRSGDLLIDGETADGHDFDERMCGTCARR